MIVSSLSLIWWSANQLLSEAHVLSLKVFDLTSLRAAVAWMPTRHVTECDRMILFTIIIRNVLVIFKPLLLLHNRLSNLCHRQLIIRWHIRSNHIFINLILALQDLRRHAVPRTNLVQRLIVSYLTFWLLKSDLLEGSLIIVTLTKLRYICTHLMRKLWWVQTKKLIKDSLLVFSRHLCGWCTKDCSLCQEVSGMLLFLCRFQLFLSSLTEIEVMLLDLCKFRFNML